MPATDRQDVRRGKLLQGLFWGGVALASLAILILLFGQGTGALRVAVVCSVLTIVMLAVSVALRPSVELVRIDIEERVLNEVDRVRMRARADVTTAARNTHRALSDKIGALTETVELLRGQIDLLQANAALGQSSPAVGHPSGQPGGPGVVRRTETVHVTRRTTTVDAGDDDGRGTVYGSRAAVDGEWRERSDDHRGRRGGGGGSGEESEWEATFRSLSSKQPAQRALPPSRGERPDRYVDDRDDYERVRHRDRDYERDRDYDRDRDHDRDRDYERDRDRGYERDRDRGYDRDSDYRDREYRDREYRDREYRDREYRDRDRDRDYRDRDHPEREYRDRDYR